MGTLEALLETGVGALALAFGVVGTSVYLTGSIDGLPVVIERFGREVVLGNEMKSRRGRDGYQPPRLRSKLSTPGNSALHPAR